MTEFIKRIEVEHEELGDKVKALRSFIGSEKFKTITPDEQALLKLQLRQMEAYLSTLVRRLQFYSVIPTNEELAASTEEQLDLGDEDSPNE